MDITDILNKFAERNDMVIGVCDAAPYDIAYDRLRTVPFVKYSAEERTDSKKTMPGCNSVIVAGVGCKKNFMFDDDDMPRGILSHEAIGADYHIVLKQKLNELIELMKNYYELEYITYVDTGPLIEKKLLLKSGLGWAGKNNLVCNAKYGSFFNAGYILTDLNIDNNKTEIPQKCGDCTLCIDACPNGALNVNGFDYTQCVSYITQKKGPLTPEEQRIMHTNIYGCDVCRTVCPYNADVAATDVIDIDAAKPELNKIINMAKTEFRNIYGRSVLYWRGLNIFKRNAAIALRNNGRTA